MTILSWGSLHRLLFIVLLVSAPPLAADSVKIFVAKKIISMEAERDSATAVAVAKGRVIAIGDADELREKLQESLAEPVQIDRTFEHKILMPGFIDNHLHPTMAALLLPMEFITPFDWRFPDRDVAAVQGQENYRDRLIERIALSDQKSWFITWGYHHYFHGEMSRAYLDSISGSQPVVVWHRSFHELIANTAAIKAMGIEAEDVQDHPHVKLAEGHFFETGLSVAMAKMSSVLLSEERFRRGLQLTKKIVHAGGITTIADMSAGGFDFDRSWPLVAEVFGDAPFRTLMVANGNAFGTPAGGAKSLARLQELQQLKAGNISWLKQVKLFADGAFYSQLMQMNPPGYLDGHKGEWLMDPKVLMTVARRYWQAGYQIHVHTNGDRGVDVVLDVLAVLLSEMPRQDHRFTLHHVGYTTTEQAKRMGELGAFVSAQPYYLYTLGEKYSEIGLGAERAEKIFLGQEFIKAGVPLSLHSDFTMAPAEPLLLAWVAANRLTASGSVLAPELRLSRDQALRAITIEAARAIQMEHEIGSIKIGKQADFTVLDEDPYHVPIEKLHQVPVFATVLSGEIFLIKN